MNPVNCTVDVLHIFLIQFVLTNKLLFFYNAGVNNTVFLQVSSGAVNIDEATFCSSRTESHDRDMIDVNLH